MAFTWGKDIKDVKMKEIPDYWVVFGDGHDRIKSVGEIPVKYDIDIMLYEAKAGTTFPIHVHNDQNEKLLVYGQMVLVTPEGRRLIKEGGSAYIPAGMPHICEFKTDTLLILTYSPANGHKWTAQKPNNERLF